jgi:hypothetical protein
MVFHNMVFLTMALANSQLPVPKVTQCDNGQRKNEAGFCLTDIEKEKLIYSSFQDAANFNRTNCPRGIGCLFKTDLPKKPTNDL